MHCNTQDEVKGFNTFNSLNAVIEKIISNNLSFEFVLVSGDISQTCTCESYQLFQTTLQRLNKPIYCIPGNHDNASFLQQYFPSTPTNTINKIEHKNTLFLLVNTQVKNQQYGIIKDNDINEIITTLKSTSTQNIIIVIHHPPIKIQSLWMDNIGLKNGAAFLNAVGEFKNLKLILFGHVHQAIDTKFKHINILATPSTCYQFKPKEDTFTYDDLPAGFRVVKISASGTIESNLYRV